MARRDYQHVYIIQTRLNINKSNNWNNTGREWYSCPQGAMIEAKKLQSQFKDRLFRPAKFVFVHEVNGSGERADNGKKSISGGL